MVVETTLRVDYIILLSWISERVDDFKYLALFNPGESHTLSCTVRARVDGRIQNLKVLTANIDRNAGSNNSHQLKI